MKKTITTTLFSAEQIATVNSNPTLNAVTSRLIRHAIHKHIEPLCGRLEEPSIIDAEVAGVAFGILKELAAIEDALYGNEVDIDTAWISHNLCELFEEWAEKLGCKMEFYVFQELEDYGRHGLTFDVIDGWLSFGEIICEKNSATWKQDIELIEWTLAKSGLNLSKEQARKLFSCAYDDDFEDWCTDYGFEREECEEDEEPFDRWDYEEAMYEDAMHAYH